MSTGANLPYARPLTERFALPVTQVHEIPQACDPVVPVLPADSVLWQDLHPARGGDPFQEIERSIRWPGPYRVNLVTGLVGAGKTTEVLRLMQALQQEKEGKIFHVLYLDATELLDASEIGLPDLLAAFLPAMAADPILDVPSSARARELWQDVRRWTRSVGREVAEDLASGTRGLRALFKTPGFQRSYRERAEPQVHKTLEMLGGVIGDVRDHLVGRGIDDIVIVIDNLEKIHFRIVDTETGKRTSHEILFLQQLRPIQDLPVHLVITFPLSVHLWSVGVRNVYPHSNTAMVPMVHVRERGTKAPYEAGIEALTGLVARRVRIDTVFASPGVLRRIILASGGCLRDILRVIGQAAYMKGELPIDDEVVNRVLKEQIRVFERALQGSPHLAGLHEIERTGRFPGAFDNNDRMRLLEELVVIEYNSELWYDVHPFAKGTRVYRDAAPDADVVGEVMERIRQAPGEGGGPG